jgi:hypothetical protein
MSYVILGVGYAASPTEQHRFNSARRRHGDTGQQGARACFPGKAAASKTRPGSNSNTSIPGTSTATKRATHATAQTTGVKAANSAATGHRAARSRFANRWD